MTQGILDDFDIYASLAHPCGKGVPEGMAAKVRKQHGVFFTLLQHLVIAVPDNSADCLVQRSLVVGSFSYLATR